MAPTSAAAAKPAPYAPASVAEIKAAIRASLEARRAFDKPYRHYLVDDLFPKPVADKLAALPFRAPGLDGVSGKRELHNDTRRYFDKETMAEFPTMARVAEALQATDIVSEMAATFDAPLDDTFLRLEYAQDVDGFWLEPHTDLGVKKFTCLIYLASGPEQEDLGTDIYASRTEHVGAPPFVRNSAMIFVPGSDTWHGFEKRPIHGVRRSVILNYVTHDWRAREQLSFPETTVRVSETDPAVARTVDLLGGQRVLRRAVRNRLDAHDLLKEGLPGHALRHLVENVDILRASGSAGLESAVGISLRTFQRRKEAPDKRLDADQSGRAWKFAEILARTIDLLGSKQDAERWLAKPAMALDGRKPIDLLLTPAGVEVLEDHLGRLEYGVYT